MQAAGAGTMSTSTVEKYNLGAKVTVGGLGVQLLFFGAFMGVVLVYSTTGLAGIQPKLQTNCDFAGECKGEQKQQEQDRFKGALVE